jgi:NAD(P)H-nitrite reductase large subunit
MLSKVFKGKKATDFSLRNAEFLKKYDIEVVTDCPVESIDYEKKTVKTNKSEIKYDKLLIATGSTPNRPPIKGINLQNVFTYRNGEDYA